MAGRYDDAQEIRKLLEDRIESVLDEWFPGWVERGGKAYLTPKGPKDLGSFQVNLTGARRGQWYRHSQQIGGGAVELVSYALTNGKDSYAVAFREARRFLGLEKRSVEDAAESQDRKERAEREARERRVRAEREEEARKKRRAATAAEIWNEGVPLHGTIAENYMAIRGIPIPPGGWPDVLRYHQCLEYELGATWDGDRKVARGPIFPCLIAKVENLAGEVISVWRIFLNPITGDKAAVDNPKVGLGSPAGGAVRIGGVGKHIGIAEGVETAMGAWALLGYGRPVWSVLSTSGMVNVELPLAVERVSIFPDGDKPLRRMSRDGEYIPTKHGPGMKAALDGKERLVGMGIRCTIEPEPGEGSDYLDIWNSMRRLGGIHGDGNKA